MPWAFTDEPAVPSFIPGRQMPWTGALPELFRRKKGYDLLELCRCCLRILRCKPAMQGKPGSTSSTSGASFSNRPTCCRSATGAASTDCFLAAILAGKTRRWAPRVMATATSCAPCGEWICPAWIPSGGTVFPASGITIFPATPEASPGRKTGTGVPTESFSVYGNGLTLAEMKWLVDYQYVRGCNILVMGNYPAGSSGNLMSGERPHLGPVSPLWQYQPIFQDYTARLGYVMSLGSGAADTALYFPVRDFWAAAPAPSTPEAQANDDAALELESHQVDFDFVDDDLLRPDAVSGGVLYAGKMSYRTLVVSQTRMMPDRDGGRAGPIRTQWRDSCRGRILARDRPG